MINFNCLYHKTPKEDIKIDIFGESIAEYVQKLNKASTGRYELDNYDRQVLIIAMEQFAPRMGKSYLTKIIESNADYQ